MDNSEDIERGERRPIRFTWPDGDNTHGSSATSGVHCLLVLMKAIRVSLEQGSFSKKFDSNLFFEMEDDDWSENGPDLDTLAMEVWHRPFDAIPAIELCFSALLSLPYCERFWSEPAMHPWRPPRWRYTTDSCWYKATAKDTPWTVIQFIKEFGCNATTIGPNSFQFNAFPTMDIGEAVGARFGVLDTHEPNVVFPAVHSLFFYAMFNVCNVNDEARLDFDKFRTFEIEPVDPMYGDMRRMRFNLAAIVKFRSQPDGIDSIRLYHVDGHHMCPESSLQYANPEWKFADFVNGDTFFALYAHSWVKPKEGPPFPELSDMKDENQVQGRLKARMAHAHHLRLLLNEAEDGSWR